MNITSVKKNKDGEKGEKKSLDLSSSKPSILQSRKGVLILSVFAAIIVSLIAYYGFVQAQYNRVGLGKELDIVALDTQLETKQKQLDLLKELQGNFESITSTEIDLVSRILPSEEQIPELLTQLEAIARQSGVSLIGVNVTPVEDAPKQSARQRLQDQLQDTDAPTLNKDIQIMSIQLDVSVFNYLSFEQFIESLQSHTRIMDIQRMNYSTENQFHSITVHTYYLES